MDFVLSGSSTAEKTIKNRGKEIIKKKQEDKILYDSKIVRSKKLNK